MLLAAKCRNQSLVTQKLFGRIQKGHKYTDMFFIVSSEICFKRRYVCGENRTFVGCNKNSKIEENNNSFTLSSVD
jgi:hypothetical protein